MSPSQICISNKAAIKKGYGIYRFLGNENLLLDESLLLLWTISWRSGPTIVNALPTVVPAAITIHSVS